MRRGLGQFLGFLALATCGLLAGPAGHSATSATSATDTAALDGLGRREAFVHDPSTLLRVGDTWWLFATGRGVSVWRSADRTRWERAGSVFSETPSWVTGVVPGQRGHFWAPDVVRVRDRVLLYFSVSSFGKNTSAIALASSPVAVTGSGETGFAWKDEGVVVRSRAGDDYNAIDPSLLLDRDGRLWMAFGSFWGGIQLCELDPLTGRSKAPQPGLRRVAWKKEIEAPALHRRGDWYYLFVNWGFCCRGADSTYEVRVGRSREVVGPYVDRDGEGLLEGGGTLFLATEGSFIGPGHVGWLEDGGEEWVSVHFYDGTQNGKATLAIRRLTWTDDGWPVAGGR